MMPFGLINVGTIYERIVNKLFVDMIGDTMEEYVNDMLVKSQKGTIHLRDLEQDSAKMKLHNIHMNPSKCTLGVSSRNVFGFMMRQRGIELSLEISAL